MNIKCLALPFMFWCAMLSTWEMLILKNVLTSRCVWTHAVLWSFAWRSQNILLMSHSFISRPDLHFFPSICSFLVYSLFMLSCKWLCLAKYVILMFFLFSLFLNFVLFPPKVRECIMKIMHYKFACWLLK